MRISIQIPAIAGPTERYTATAARSLLNTSTTLTLDDGSRVLAVIVFAVVVDDGSALVVTLDYDPPNAARGRRRSQVTTARSRANGQPVTSQVTAPSQPRSQRGSQGRRRPPAVKFRPAEGT